MRLQKIMDEYGAGVSAWYTTNGPTLQRGIELIEMLREDLSHLAARTPHELMRCWELVHRAWVGEAHLRHLLYPRRDPLAGLLLSLGLPQPR